MGHPCAIGFQLNQQIKATYSHWGSYPAGLGKEITRILTKMTDSHRDDFKKRAESIQWVSNTSKANEEDIKRYKNFARSTIIEENLTDWRNLLFKTEGSIGLVYLLAGQLDHFIDNTAMLEDSLMCESGYIFNFDDNTLDFYDGAQTSPDPKNPFGQEVARTFEGRSYYPCKRVLQIDLANPMGCAEWISMIEEK